MSYVIKYRDNFSIYIYIYIYIEREREREREGVKNFLFSKLSRSALGLTHFPVQWVPGALSPGVKQPRCEADHSPPASAEVKKTCIFISTPLYVFMS
jgi:hypothetical protein